MLKVSLFSVWLVGLVPLLAQAYTGVTVVMHEKTEANKVFVAELKDVLIRQHGNTLRVSEQVLKPRTKLVVAENSELVIAIGEQAFEVAAKLSYTTPVLGVQVSLPTLESVQRKSRRNASNISAITLYQPNARILALVENVLPQAKRLGMLVGQNTVFEAEQLKSFALKRKLHVEFSQVNFQVDLMSKLGAVLQSTDALIAYPDAEIFNRETAQPIFLTSYRNKKPVLGCTQTIVKAGALAAVFSDSKHLARQAAEIAVHSQSASALLPPPQNPKYFSVSVNKQVARLLNIKVMNEALLYKMILAVETASQ